MIPRAHVDTVRADEPLSSVLGKMGAGHTRYPVVGTSSDDLRGVIHLHDLLGDQADGVARPGPARPSSCRRRCRCPTCWNS